MDISPIASSASYPADSSAMSMALRGAHTPAEQRKVVAGQFEAILLRQFLSDSVGSMMGGENSPAGSVYGYLLTDVLSQKLAAGGGMGISKVIEQQLAPRGQTAAPGAAAKGTS
jgi:Rod binding domain-containing protein